MGKTAQIKAQKREGRKMQSCAITGHRVLKKDFTEDYVREKILELIMDGTDTFYFGMAVGFDMVCAEILCSMKEDCGLRLVACIPCGDQSENFSFAEKRRYRKILEQCDEVVVLHEKYVDGCMLERNRYMVDRSDVVLAYLHSDRGGTYYTVRYAKRKRKDIVFV